MSSQNIEEIIVSRIQADISAAEVTLRDMTGTRDHWEAVIISEDFEGKRLIVRQKLVYQALGELMAGPIHAFTMQTLTPSEAQAKGLVSKSKDPSQSSPSNDTLITLK